jgi:membrane-associated phospholipid phosphatase
LRSRGASANPVAAARRLALGPGDLSIWPVIALFWAGDALLARATGITIDRLDLFALPALILLPNVAFYVWRGTRRPFDLTHCVARFYTLALAATLLTYLVAAATPIELADPWLARADAALGFSWPDWWAVVTAHPSIETVFAFAYDSMQWQILLCVLWSALFGPVRRAHETVWALALSITFTVAFSAILPATGAWAYFGYAAASPSQNLLQFLALRDGGLRLLAPGDLGGIVTFPSYHAVWALLVPWLLRGTSLFVPALLLNATMMVATISEGGHYLVDLLGGGAVAAATIAALLGVPILTRPAPGEEVPEGGPSPSYGRPATGKLQ